MKTLLASLFLFTGCGGRNTPIAVPPAPVPIHVPAPVAAWDYTSEVPSPPIDQIQPMYEKAALAIASLGREMKLECNEAYYKSAVQVVFMATAGRCNQADVAAGKCRAPGPVYYAVPNDGRYAQGHFNFTDFPLKIYALAEVPEVIYYEMLHAMAWCNWPAKRCEDESLGAEWANIGHGTFCDTLRIQ